MVAITLCSLCAVCASTSVAAADNSKTESQAPSLVGAAMPSGASVVVGGTDRTSGTDALYLFAKGADNALYWKAGAPSTNTWSSWNKIPTGYLTSDPAAVSLAPGEINVYVRGGDGALWMLSTRTYGGTWSDWSKIGGYIYPGTGPAACISPGGETTDVAIFVTGGDHAIWQYFVDGWSRFGGYATSSPTAAGNGVVKPCVYVRGGDGALWEYDIPDDNTTAARWINLGGYILPGTSPAASDIYTGTLTVFVTGGNRALWWEAKTGAGSWSGWTSLNGYLTSSPTSTQSGSVYQSSSVYTFVRGGDGGLWWIKGTMNAWPYTWSSWTSMGGM